MKFLLIAVILTVNLVSSKESTDKNKNSEIKTTNLTQKSTVMPRNLQKLMIKPLVNNEITPLSNKASLT
jgi:hypothetical protein